MRVTELGVGNDVEHPDRAGKPGTIDHIAGATQHRGEERAGAVYDMHATLLP
ncbi:MAG: hypothetical protein HYY30_09200 [Chloroflexi bacterium]|nr:hypothetical protein [Chloroflexota bacterium]